jgi:predicted ATPase/DNA-binding winged helix-turn-helix (wHTH) protein
MGLSATPSGSISFGPFSLLPEQGLLLESGRPLHIGSRAFAILNALVENAGDIVSKGQLMNKAWPDTYVEECSLRVHVYALRKALGDGQSGQRYVLNIPGRGYRFVAPVARSNRAPFSALRPPQSPTIHNLPAQLSGIVGRSDLIAEIAEKLPQRGLITIVGPGGVGKTTVATAAAHKLIDTYPDGVYFVDLVPVSDIALVSTALANVLGVASQSGDPLSGIIAFLKDARALLVIDNCEHVISAAAELTERIHRGAVGTHILATSREPLRTHGERVWRLESLAVPPASSRLTVKDALGYSAIRLFVERMAFSVDSYELSDTDVPIVTEICRQLDGNPLALELAAGRADVFGVAGLAAHLDKQLSLLTRGRRTAIARHQALSATLDWSYQLLPESERIVLRRLAAFAGDFTFDAARLTAADTLVSDTDVVESVANLVSKSLAVVDTVGPVAHYHLLETTRAYALEKLISSGEASEVSQRHAEYFCKLFGQAEADWETTPTVDWVATYGRQVDNLRAALDWSLVQGHAPAAGASAVAGSRQIWLQNALVSEGARWVSRALDLGRHALPTRTEAGLQYTAGRLRSGSSYEQASASFARAVELWREIGNAAELGCSLMSLGVALARQGRAQDGEILLSEGQVLLAKTDYRKSYARTFLDRAIIVMIAGRFEEAFAMIAPAATRARDAGAERGVIRSMIYLAECEFALDRIDDAIAHGREAVALCRTTRRSRHLGHALCNLGAYLAHSGEKIEAASSLSEGLLLVREELGAMSVALALQHCAWVSVISRNYERGARIIGFAEAAGAVCSYEHTPRKSYNSATERLNYVLNRGSLAELRGEGMRLSSTQAIEEALSI